MLEDLADDLNRIDIKLVFAGVKGPVRDLLVKYRMVNKIGEENFFDNIPEALKNFDGDKSSDKRVGFQSNYKPYEIEGMR